jgi:hypothetical protein
MKLPELVQAVVHSAGVAPRVLRTSDAGPSWTKSARAAGKTKEP